MKPQAALIELLARVGASQGAATLLNNHELNQWPNAAVAAMKKQQLLTQAPPAATAVCPGCERDCVMPVFTRNRPLRGAVSFIDCDKRDDVGQVPVPVERLQQWRCTTDAVCGFIAASLGLRRSDKRLPVDVDSLEIGVASGHKRIQMLCLQTAGELFLVAGGNKVPLAEAIAYGEDTYSVDGSMIRLLVDAATTADDRYTPSNAKREARKLETQAMYKEWKKAYRDLSKNHKGRPNTWYAQQIAKMPIAQGRNASTIKKHMLS